MTKKSYSRIQRDLAEKNQQERLKTNTVWTEVSDIANQIRTLLSECVNKVQLTQDPELVPFFPSLEILNINIKTFMTDIQSVAGEFSEINIAHANKIGNASTPDEYMNAIQVYQRYAALYEKIDGVLLPTLNHILKDVGTAIDNKVKSEVQNPNIVTDVEFKDVTN